MDLITDILFYKYQLFLLIFVRVSGIFVFSPLFSSQNVPNSLKLGFSFFFIYSFNYYTKYWLFIKFGNKLCNINY